MRGEQARSLTESSVLAGGESEKAKRKVTRATDSPSVALISTLKISGSHLVTGLTIFGNPECRRTIVAGSTVFAFFHGFHGHLVCALLRFEQVGVTFVAAERFDVDSMGERDIAGILVNKDDVSGMAGCAVTFDTESLLAIVAETTGFAFFHVGHGVGRILLGDDVKNVIVASWTVIADGFHLQVSIVAELDLAYRVGLQINFIFYPASVKD